MKIFSRYIIRNLFLGFAAAAGLLLPLFTTFNLIGELDDVSPDGYRWTQAVMVVLMTLPRTLIDLGPFIALLGGIIGLGQLSKSGGLTAIRTTGCSIFKIAIVTLSAGLMLIVALGVIDEWIASPMQQQALQIKTRYSNHDTAGNILWARRGNVFVTVKSLDAHRQPEGIELFYYRADHSLQRYIYARTATISDNGVWRLEGVNQKAWANGKETTETKENVVWSSLFGDMSLEELTLPSSSFSVKQLSHYISYLKSTGQPSLEFTLALWLKLGHPLLILAMILLAIPFTFSTPRAPGLGSRLAVGVIVGLLTYVCDQIIVNLGLLYSLNVQMTTLAPPILLLAVALILVYRFDRQP